MIAGIGILIFLLPHCKEKEIYPVIPSIQYKSISFIENSLGLDSMMQLDFTFKDGDGDIGLDDGDTFPPFNPIVDSAGNSKNKYYYNAYVYLYKQTNGVFYPVMRPFVNDTFFYAFRAMNITPDGRHKAIRGDIDITIEEPVLTNPGDTVKYVFYIYDRALHQSNWAESPPLVWNR